MRKWMRPAALAVAAWLMVWGCGEKKEPEGDQMASADTLSFEKQLEQDINRVMDRLKYDDRSGLWENEFEYLREERTFDDYLKQPSVSRAKADTLEWVEVHSATRYGDSAVAKVTVHFKGLSGAESTWTEARRSIRRFAEKVADAYVAHASAR